MVVHTDDITDQEAYRIIRDGIRNGEDMEFTSATKFISHIFNDEKATN